MDGARLPCETSTVRGVSQCIAELQERLTFLLWTARVGRSFFVPFGPFQHRKSGRARIGSPLTAPGDIFQEFAYNLGVPKGHPALRICKQCGGRTKKAENRYCSPECFGLATRTTITTPCQRSGCLNPVDETPSRRAEGRGQYCSRECADLAKAAPKPVVICARDGCADPVKYVGARPREFCSVRCSKLQHPPQTCVVCRATFDWRSSPNAKNLYCNPACHAKAQRRREARICRACGSSFEAKPSRKLTQCPTCRLNRGSQFITCQLPGCTNTRRVFRSALRKPGAGKYCSVAHRNVSLTGARIRTTCHGEGCSRTFEGRPGRRFHSLACYRSSLRARAQCFVCHRPRHGNPRFCSPTCTYKGRRRRSADPRVQERNEWIARRLDDLVQPKRIAYEWNHDHPAATKPLSEASVWQVAHKLRSPATHHRRR
jgi:hypothetical protein